MKCIVYIEQVWLNHTAVLKDKTLIPMNDLLHLDLKSKKRDKGAIIEGIC